MTRVNRIPADVHAAPRSAASRGLHQAKYASDLGDIRTVLQYFAFELCTHLLQRTAYRMQTFGCGIFVFLRRCKDVPECFDFFPQFFHVRKVGRCAGQFLLKGSNETADAFETEFRVLCSDGGTIAIVD